MCVSISCWTPPLVALEIVATWYSALKLNLATARFEEMRYSHTHTKTKQTILWTNESDKDYSQSSEIVRKHENHKAHQL